MATVGLPEGAPISPILANLYLNTIDQRFPLTRYGDNFVVCTHDLDKTLRALCTQLHDVGLYTHFLFTDQVRFCGYEGSATWSQPRLLHGLDARSPGLPQRSIQVVTNPDEGLSRVTYPCTESEHEHATSE